MSCDMEECRADKNWAHFYNINKTVQKLELSKMLIHSKNWSPNPIFLKEIPNFRKILTQPHFSISKKYIWNFRVNLFTFRQKIIRIDTPEPKSLKYIYECRYLYRITFWFDEFPTANKILAMNQNNRNFYILHSWIYKSQMKCRRNSGPEIEHCFSF